MPGQLTEVLTGVLSLILATWEGVRDCEEGTHQAAVTSMAGNANHVTLMFIFAECVVFEK